MRYRTLAYVSQWFGALVLAVAGFLSMVFWFAPRWTGLLMAFFVGFPLGCLLGLYAGGKLLLKHKGRNQAGAVMAVITTVIFEALPLGFLVAIGERGFNLNSSEGSVNLARALLPVAVAGVVVLMATIVFDSAANADR